MTPKTIDECMMLADTIHLVLVCAMGDEALADSEQPICEAMRGKFAHRLPPVTSERVVDDDLLIEIAKSLWPDMSEEDIRIWVAADRESLVAQGFVEGTEEAALQDLLLKRDRGLATADDLSRIDALKRSCPFVHDYKAS